MNVKPHNRVPFNLHAFKNELTYNTNRDLITERDHLITSDYTNSFDFDDNIKNAKKKWRHMISSPEKCRFPRKS